MIWFCYFCKKNLSFVLGVAHNDSFCAPVAPKNGNFQRFYNFFFRTTVLQLKLLKLIKSTNIFHWKSEKVGVALGQYLCQIRSNVVKKVKKLALSIGFFQQWLHKHLSGNLRQTQLEITYLKDIRAKFLPDLGQKMAKKMIFFQEFHFSQSNS